jgi:hypothetical protein
MAPEMNLPRPGAVKRRPFAIKIATLKMTIE